ncbi:MAG: imidazole glycerol phosphate synthase subunit HisH [Nitrospirae bacterium]|nr:imidazole glycerol phosphate synthase subunit HisH [Nitrospirota bacterium]MBF0535144.1 imidazole glycerol phosphate synthase subunit HisH [Nitrospirota bacterium]MBF0615237.1 imidazole glycerol phosphate synthase subunit HisH [Nitrospirota bacterium]
MIAILDYGMGNLRSVQKGFLKVGIEAIVTSKSSDIDNAAGVVIPGVGAFRDCMVNLQNLDLIETIKRSIEKGKPFLGICLGLQLLFTESEEFGNSTGLGVFKGKVVRFKDKDLKIPHMGWNVVSFKKKPPLFEGIEDGSYFYFVHSYYVSPEDQSIISGVTPYGVEFTSMVWKDNVFAMQFHPEKSQAHGLKILENFGKFVKAA